MKPTKWWVTSLYLYCNNSNSFEGMHSLNLGGDDWWLSLRAHFSWKSNAHNFQVNASQYNGPKEQVPEVTTLSFKLFDQVPFDH